MHHLILLIVMNTLTIQGNLISQERLIIPTLGAIYCLVSSSSDFFQRRINIQHRKFTVAIRVGGVEGTSALVAFHDRPGPSIEMDGSTLGKTPSGLRAFVRRPALRDADGDPFYYSLPFLRSAASISSTESSRSPFGLAASRVPAHSWHFIIVLRYFFSTSSGM